MKGIFFTLDVIFAIIIAVIMVLAINFFLIRVEKDPAIDLYIEKTANSILFSLVKNKTFESNNVTYIGSAFSDTLPENLGGILNVKMYKCLNQACNDFNKTTEYTINKCRIDVVDVVLVIDKSGSMAGEPLADAKVAAKLFVDQLDQFNDRSGLVSFGWTASLDRNLTTDKNSVKSGIDSLIAFGGTAIGSGIQAANNHLSTNGRGSTKWAEVLISDGENNFGTDPITAANNAKNLGITIYTIGLGDDADQPTMAQIANMTGGKFYYAPDSNKLNDIYAEIARELLATETEVSLAQTSFVTFQGAQRSTVNEFGIAELRMCLI